MFNILNRVLKILFLFVFFFYLENVFSQDKPLKTHSVDTSRTHKVFFLKMILHSAPSITMQFSGSYDFGVYELSANNNGDFNSIEFSNGKNFGVRHGVGGNLTVKIPLHERGNLRLNISLLYNRFNSNFSKVMSVNPEREFAKYSVYSCALGIENNFTPSYKIKTFVGGGFVASVISGQARIFDNGVYGNLSIIPAFRLGLSLYSGLEYMINNKIGFNTGFMFIHANLWLKQSKQSTDPSKIYLNDRLVKPRLPYSGFKQFAWGSFFAGVNYYFGISDKEYIYQKR